MSFYCDPQNHKPSYASGLPQALCLHCEPLPTDASFLVVKFLPQMYLRHPDHFKGPAAHSPIPPSFFSLPVGRGLLKRLIECALGIPGAVCILMLILLPQEGLPHKK